MFDPKIINYELPPELVAKSYPETRSDVRLMVLDRKTGRFYNKKFVDILEYIEGDLCVANGAVCDPKHLHKSHREPLYADRKSFYYTTVIPTAGVPFEQWMLDRIAPLQLIYLTTPYDERPSQTECYRDKKTAAESYHVPFVPEGKYTVLGTTALKALESDALYRQSSGVSDLMILPGFEFKRTEKLLTNFHYPKECQLALTCAFGGVGFVMDVYRHAIKLGYKVSDRGDRMLII